jgi:hypothetical protein
MVTPLDLMSPSSFRSDVTIIIRHLYGDGIARISLTDELAIRDHGTSHPGHCRLGTTPATAMAAVPVLTSFPPQPPNPGVPLGGLKLANLCGTEEGNPEMIVVTYIVL